ncbi:MULTISPECIES: P-type conjugative transfer protein TrbL [unclassified Nitrobacter]|uniref:P-type conjugative transfer protein TrbL n=1 Tax=unclassified Nitrobacter TaxID=2620411 RepID=UPI000925C528|nr:MULTISPECIES: P-type conjugative transfer protein TrbL [unclassified Nitrobacter]MBN9147927.1 P-type conjugative transfer protein TrbL [Nitrobacter sp.]MBN9489911.1 P-type conjugative transfer protein TrbL [Alphaproteobacteria bacterium]OJV01502.1 MAG: P-type conjugative transfer protein TrbL [Nitrobacter sp. 62-23]
MDNLSVIDRFTDTFSQYIDSGFGLLGGEIAFLSATLIVIDISLAGLFWAFAAGHDEILAKLIKKVLYVGAFAYIITNFNTLAGIIFKSFSGLGLKAAGSGLSADDFLRAGKLASVGMDAGRPILQQIGELSGFTSVFSNIDTIAVLFLAWLVVIISFFVLAVQLFVTLLEFKLTTLAGFVLVPFALWNKTAFLAERVLGHVISSGIKILVLAVIVGIGNGLFAEFRASAPSEPSIDHALAIMLASLAMLGLGIFGPSIATGLVSGAPQLGAGAAAGTALAAGGLAVAGGAAAAGAARLGGAAVSSGVKAASSMSGGARTAFGLARATSGASGAAALGAGLAGVASAGGGAFIQAGRNFASRMTGAMHQSAARGSHGAWTATCGTSTAGMQAAAGGASGNAPAWANRFRHGSRGSQATHGATMAAHTLRSGDHGGSGANPSLRQEN